MDMIKYYFVGFYLYLLLYRLIGFAIVVDRVLVQMWIDDFENQHVDIMDLCVLNLLLFDLHRLQNLNYLVVVVRGFVQLSQDFSMIFHVPLYPNL